MSATGTQIFNHLVPSASGSDVLALAVLRPLAEIAGMHLAEKFKQGMTAGDRDNIISHIESVKESGDVKATVQTSQKAENTVEWAVAAADVNQRDNPELAAAWRAVLESILQDNDYGQIDVVKRLDQIEVRAIQQMLRAQSGGAEFHNSDVGDRLKALGLARQSFLESNLTRSLIRVFSVSVVGAIFLYVFSTMMDYGPFRDEFRDRAFSQIISVCGTSMVLLYLFSFTHVLTKRSKSLRVYLLTAHGEKLARRVEKYLTAIEQASRP